MVLPTDAPPKESATATLTFRLTEDEHLRALRAMATRSPYSNLFYGLVLGLPIALGAIIDLASAGRASLGLPVKLPMWWSGAVLSGALGSAFFFISRRSDRRAFRTGAAAKGDLAYVLSATGLKVEGPGVATSATWESLARVVETPEFVLFYVSSAAALILPRRALTSDARSLLPPTTKRH